MSYIVVHGKRAMKTFSKKYPAYKCARKLREHGSRKVKVYHY